MVSHRWDLRTVWSASLQDPTIIHSPTVSIEGASAPRQYKIGSSHDFMSPWGDIPSLGVWFKPRKHRDLSVWNYGISKKMTLDHHFPHWMIIIWGYLGVCHGIPHFRTGLKKFLNDTVRWWFSQTPGHPNLLKCMILNHLRNYPSSVSHHWIVRTWFGDLLRSHHDQDQNLQGKRGDSCRESRVPGPNGYGEYWGGTIKLGAPTNCVFFFLLRMTKFGFWGSNFLKTPYGFWKTDHLQNKREFDIDSTERGTNSPWRCQRDATHV